MIIMEYIFSLHVVVDIYINKLGMAMVTDFRNRLLGKTSGRVTGYSDNRQV